MDSTKTARLQKLENHLILLKEEYGKLQRNYADLQRKYSKAVASTSSESCVDFNSLVSQLVLTVASLYGRMVYSDLSIKINTKVMPAHKFVFQARSEQWREEVLANVTELDWTHLDEDIAIALLRWIYTDVVDLQHDRIALGLLKMANRFNLPGLSGLCERALVASVNVRSCVRLYCVAEDMGAASLLEYCSGLISTYWHDLNTQDFEHMSGPLLFKMLKTKTEYPLHTAVRLLRKDVVFLCLKEYKEKLPKFVNSLSDQGLLPLQMALTSKNLAIAQTLVTNGSADINAYDSEGYTILIDAIRRGDKFSAAFVLERNCNVDLPSRKSSDTALHTVCSYNLQHTNSNMFADMIDIGKLIISKCPNVNLQNHLGETPLHLAIKAGNNVMVDNLLAVPKIDINLRTNNDQCCLELCLMNGSEDVLQMAAKLIKLGANPNPLKRDTNDNLLQVLANRHLERESVFLADYANLNHVNVQGLTVLHIAAKHNLKQLSTKLLNSGASPNIQSNVSGLKSALHVAVEETAADVIQAFADFSVQCKMANKSNSVHIAPDFNIRNANDDSPLSLCLQLNCSEFMPILIHGGANINARNSQGMTLLHQAILNHDSDTAKFLLHYGADMNALTVEQESPLQLSIHCRIAPVVDVLCTKGVLLSALSNKGDPPLWTALRSGYDDVAQVLVRHGVDTDCWGPGPDGCQQTLLHRAIDENIEAAAMFLIRSQCDLDSPRRLGPNGEGGDKANNKKSPLHLCAEWGFVKVLQTLIDHGANVNAIDVENKTPLHVAIENQHEEIISILLCHPEIDLKVRDKKSNTPFAAALTIRNNRVAQKILHRLPSAAEQMDSRGRNFLHLAIMRDDLEIVLFLLAIQVDVNSRVHDANQYSPLHLAATSPIEMITRNLILAGARVNERNAMLKTPLHIATERGNLGAVCALLQNGSDFDAIDGEGNNALHIAVRCGHLAIVRELLTQSNINAEAVNKRGRNPLHELCRIGEDNSGASMCDLFIESMPKYPINEPDMDGNTPLLLSFMRGQAPICKVLVKNGACLGTQNLDGISIFNFKLATDQLLHTLLDQLTHESPWSESDLCQECNTKFSLTMRKHHCRHCGRVVCSKCSNNDVPILKFGINKPVRVCSVCFDILQGITGSLR